jgi:hypothetical protein
MTVLEAVTTVSWGGTFGEGRGTMTEALGAADGTRKGDLLSNLGVLVSYDPLTRRARVTCRPKVSESVVSEGGLEPPRP